MKHEILTHSSFFEHMEEFGYFRDIEDSLPEDFTSVFEIARVIENPDSQLFKSIQQVMTVSSAIEPGKVNGREWRPNKNFTDTPEEYESTLMRNLNDVKLILPTQYALPYDVFLQRLSRRSLWINLPKNPVIVPFKSSSKDYNPNNFKQKVYMLLDTSTSMSAHHRIQMAKAVVFVFLKRNLKELGHVYFRTFDTEVGSLWKATELNSLKKLIKYVMRLKKLGNGTVMEKAIMIAINDIKKSSSLEGAEILLVTDGACHLDIEKIKEGIGKSIIINTIKIGSTTIVPDEKYLRDIASRGNAPRQKDLKKMEEELRHLKAELEFTAGTITSKALRSQITDMEHRTNQLKLMIIDDIKLKYGREIEYLSKVYVNINDLVLDDIFKLNQSEIDELKELLNAIELDFEGGFDADALREAALLYEHIQMLLHNAPNPNQKKQLEDMANNLQELLKDVGKTMSNNGSNMVSGVSSNDLRDIQMMLSSSKNGGEGFSLFQIILQMMKQLLSKKIFSGLKYFKKK
ncbi:MAG: VWA domain-containing protein [Chlorobi bacterium]|nr:VWA domain-containing protein [Chlorobiota bacterium]